MKKKIRLLVGLLLLVLLCLWTMFAGGETLLDHLPEGYWFCFQGSSSGEYGTRGGPVLSHWTKPTEMSIPQNKFQYMTPDTVRKALRGCRVEPTQEPEGLRGFSKKAWEPYEPYYRLQFLSEDGNGCEMVVSSRGLIVLTQPGEKSRLWFRDDGGAYAALKESFGDVEDMKKYRGGHPAQRQGDPYERPQVRGGKLLDALPEGHWFCFENYFGSAAEGRSRHASGNVLDTLPPRENLPKGLQYITPDTVKAALKGVKAERIYDPPLPLSGEDWQLKQGAGEWFHCTFLDEQSVIWRVDILDTGLIHVTGLSCFNGTTPQYETLFTEYYRDDGACYRALAKAFGGPEYWEK